MHLWNINRFSKYTLDGSLTVWSPWQEDEVCVISTSSAVNSMLCYQFMVGTINISPPLPDSFLFLFYHRSSFRIRQVSYASHSAHKEDSLASTTFQLPVVTQDIIPGTPRLSQPKGWKVHLDFMVCLGIELRTPRLVARHETHWSTYPFPLQMEILH